MTPTKTVKNNCQDNIDDGDVWFMEKILVCLLQEKTGKLHED